MLLFREVSHPSVGLNQFCSKVGKCISKAGRKYGGSLESELLSPVWCMAQMGRRCPRPRHPELYHGLPGWTLPWPLPGDQPDWRRSANRARADGRKKSPSHSSSTSGKTMHRIPGPQGRGHPSFTSGQTVCLWLPM